MRGSNCSILQYSWNTCPSVSPLWLARKRASKTRFNVVRNSMVGFVFHRTVVLQDTAWLSSRTVLSAVRLVPHSNILQQHSTLRLNCSSPTINHGRLVRNTALLCILHAPRHAPAPVVSKNHASILNEWTVQYYEARLFRKIGNLSTFWIVLNQTLWQQLDCEKRKMRDTLGWSAWCPHAIRMTLILMAQITDDGSNVWCR